MKHDIIQQYALHTNQESAVPPYSVVAELVSGGGQDIAWFFERKNAVEYINMKSKTEQFNKESTEELKVLAVKAHEYLVSYGVNIVNPGSDVDALKQFLELANKEHYELVYIRTNIRQFLDFLKP